jgi:hypothetical protein
MSSCHCEHSKASLEDRSRCNGHFTLPFHFLRKTNLFGMIHKILYLSCYYIPNPMSFAISIHVFMSISTANERQQALSYNTRY